MPIFAMVTEAYDLQAFLQFPAAQFLHRWLVRLRKTGTVVEICLKEFMKWVDQSTRGKSYCFRWVKEAFKILEKFGFIDIVHKYNSSEYKVCVWKEGDSCPVNFSSDLRKKNSQNGNKTSKKATSNPDDSVLLIYKNKETTNTPPACHPVVVKTNFNNQEEELFNTAKVSEVPLMPVLSTNESLALSSIPSSEDSSSSQGLSTSEEPSSHSARAQTIQSLGIKLNPHLLELVYSATESIFRNALAAVNEQVVKGVAKNPAGMLVRAIKEQWEPSVPLATNPPSTHQDILTPAQIRAQVFSPWYAWAIQQGLVQNFPERHLPICMGEPQVKLNQYDNALKIPYTLMDWRKAMALYPMPD
jgi:hypothetical protein